MQLWYYLLDRKSNGWISFLWKAPWIKGFWTGWYVLRFSWRYECIIDRRGRRAAHNLVVSTYRRLFLFSRHVSSRVRYILRVPAPRELAIGRTFAAAPVSFTRDAISEVGELQQWTLRATGQQRCHSRRSRHRTLQRSGHTRCRYFSTGHKCSNQRSSRAHAIGSHCCTTRTGTPEAQLLARTT